MTCQNCHHELSPDAMFCGNCGLRLDAIDAPTTLYANTTATSQDADQTTANSPNSGKAIAAFVVSILGVVGALIPILGIAMGATALALGIKSRASSRKVFATIAMVLSVIVILLSLIVWYVGAQKIMKDRQVANGTGVTQSISTPCYTTALSELMLIIRNNDSCAFQATNKTSGEQYVVKVQQVASLNETNLAELARPDAQNAINAIPGGKMIDAATEIFSGSPAYTVTLSSDNGTVGTLEYIYKPTPQGNLVLIIHLQRSGKNFDLVAIEKNWSWQ